jgi:DNA-binding HxlR family transcriptional regulator
MCGAAERLASAGRRLSLQTQRLPSAGEGSTFAGMGRTANYSNEHCPVAAALAVVGDPWTLLILRDAFFGVKRFDDWQARLGVARNVLAARLKSLVQQGVLETRLYSEHPPRKDYVLTRKGRDLMPVIVSLKAWGDRHVYGEAARPLTLIHDCGAELTPRLVCEACGEAVSGPDLKARTGKAASVGEALAAASGRGGAA